MISSLKQQGFALAGGNQEVSSTDHQFGPVKVDKPSHILFSNLSGDSSFSIETRFGPHQVLQNPYKQNQILAIQRWGSNIVIFDLLSGDKKYQKSPESCVFFGHAAFLPDQMHFAVSAVDYQKNCSALAIYKSQDMKLTDIIHLPAINPHDLQVSSDHKSIWSINYGLSAFQEKNEKKKIPSKLLRLNISSFSIEEEVILPSTGIGFAHFTILPNNKIICGGLRKDFARGKRVFCQESATAICIVDQNRKITDLSFQADFSKMNNTEALSFVSLQNENQILISLPEADRLILLNLVSKKADQTIQLKSPRAILPIEKNLLISQGSGPMALLDQSLAHIAPSSPYWKGGGPHFCHINGDFDKFKDVQKRLIKAS